MPCQYPPLVANIWNIHANLFSTLSQSSVNADEQYQCPSFCHLILRRQLLAMCRGLKQFSSGSSATFVPLTILAGVCLEKHVPTLLVVLSHSGNGAKFGVSAGPPPSEGVNTAPRTSAFVSCLPFVSWRCGNVHSSQSSN